MKIRAKKAQRENKGVFEEFVSKTKILPYVKTSASGVRRKLLTPMVEFGVLLTIE
jgi:hypothetical protein